MIEVEYSGGVRLAESGLWLDPHLPKEFAFVSHAHSDHTARHGRTLCTPVTERLMEARMGQIDTEWELLEFGERREFDNWAATLLPAGHVLGSAQIFFESDKGTLLYTGDFKLRRGLSSESAAAVHAQTLIMETTYGLPRYKFPPSEQVVAQVVKFCAEAIEDGETPVLLGYALGKAQEILAALGGAGLEIVLHSSVAKLAEIYSGFGITFPPFQKYEPGLEEGRVLICPPSVNGSRMLTKIKRRRVAMLTGWALDPGAIHRLRVDAAFPLSDHADYEDLLKHVENVAPERVLTLHGFAAEFARDLRARGIEAWSLTSSDQLELIPSAAQSSTTSAPVVEVIEASGFNVFCTVGESIRESTGKLEKTRILSEYFQQLTDDELARVCVWLSGRAFPQSDEQPVNAGWAVLRRALLNVTGLAEAELRAISRVHNDAGLTTAEAMAKRPGSTAVSIAEMADFLERLRRARGPIAKVDLLTDFIKTLPSLAAGYLVRILTGDLRIGLKEGLLEDAIARAFECEPAAVREANMLLGDIGRTAVLARHHRLDEADLVLFRPIKCMLASPEPDAESVWERLGGEDGVWLEDKLDGIRAQVHCSPERTEIYSRDLKRMTDTFPEIARAGCALGYTVVFDGEILAWESGRPLSFFELQKRLGRREEDLFLGGQIPVSCVVFDILLHQQNSLLKATLAERREAILSLKLPAPFQTADVVRAHAPADIDEAFFLARKRGNEGLMAKSPTSLYTPGRRGLAWIKLKKELATLDTVVVAAEYGHGKRNTVLSDYTFAVRHGDELLVIGKAYSGLTDAEIDELTEEFLTLQTGRKSNRLQVEPKVVLEIAFDSIQPSKRHASGLALRFPRIKAIRRDKTPADIDTLDTARRLAGLAPL